MTQEDLFLQKSKELFFRLGVRSITMDDLARELGVSKKTIYKFVPNKSELVKKIMELHFNEEKTELDLIAKTSKNAMDEIVETVSRTIKHLRQIHPSSIYDIQKYYPKSWMLFHEYKNTYIYNCVISNLNKGIEQGYYRSDFKPEIVAKLYVGSVDFLVNPKNFPPTQFNFTHLYQEYIKYHLQGIASSKGVAYLKTIQLKFSDE